MWALGDDGLVYRLNTADLTVLEIDVGDRVSSISAGDGSLWALSASTGSLRRLDVVTGAVLATVPVGEGAIDLAFSHGVAWVLLGRRAALVEVDAATNAVVTRTALGPSPTALHPTDFGVFVTFADNAGLLAVSSSEVIESVTGEGQ